MSVTSHAVLADLGTLLGTLGSIRANWYNFGLQLIVDIGILDGIKVQYSDPLDCLRETLKHWLRTSSNCTWKCIVEALGSPIVGANALALEVERKHCPQLDTHTPQAQAPHAQEQPPYSQTSTPVFPQGRQAVNYPHPGYGLGLVHGLPFTPCSQMYPFTPLHPTIHNTQCYPQLPIPLPVAPSHYCQDSSTSHMHHAVYPQLTHEPSNPVSLHVLSCTDQPQVCVPTGSMYSYHSQSPIPPLPSAFPYAQPVPVHTPPPHQGRSAADYHPHSHAVQPGLTPPSLHTHPSTLQHYWPTHPSPNHSTSSLHFQPCAIHSFSPIEISSQVNLGELEVPSAAKRPCYTRSVHVPPYTTQAVSHSTSSSLSPAISKYARYLRARYKTSFLPDKNKFPRSPSNYYINLACTSRKTMSKHESEEFKVAMVQGEIDKIARDGVDFDDVAKRLPSGSYPRIVLVEGAPGVGKTTFAWEFCNKWGKGELKAEYSLVILLRLRDKRIQEAKCLRDLLYHPDETLPDVIAAELIQSLGERVLVLLEGLDELPQHQRTESSVFLDLIHGYLLPLATVLITTRPWASEYLYKNCKEKISRHIEILGFTKQQIKNYLQSVCKSDDDPSLLSDIEKYLSCYPQIHAAMYIPLNAAIVVLVYRWSRTGECIIPQTMTQLYTALSQTLLIRYLEEHPVHGKRTWRIHNFSDLPPDVYKHFLQLSKVAYDSIKNDQKLIFSSEDLPENLDTLGFMQSVPELYINESFSHNFLHLTIQEYLAAVYITQLSPEEQLKHFDEGGLFKVVVRFVAGLSKFSRMPFNSVRALFLKPGGIVNSDHVKWMFETQDPNIINAILGSGNTFGFDSKHTNMPFDCYCLGYCIAHSHCQWELRLGDDDFSIQPKDVEMLTAGASALPISQQYSSIVELFFSGCTPSSEIMMLLNTLSLHIHVELQQLSGSRCDPPSLTRVVRISPSLKEIEWTYGVCTVGDLRELCDLLASTSNSLEIIKIRESDYYDPDGELTSHMTIEGRYQHTSVSVDVHISSVDDVTSTVSVLTENSNLGLHITALRIESHMKRQPHENTSISIEGDLVCQLADALHDTTTLKTLMLINPPFGVKVAIAIGKLIHNNKSLIVEVMHVGTGVFCQHIRLKGLECGCTITVGELRKLCDCLEIVEIDWTDDESDNDDDDDGNGDDSDGDGGSYVSIEGLYPHIPVSVGVHISSVDDVTSTVSVLRENTNLGLHITAIKICGDLCDGVDGDLACQLAEALHDATTLKTFKLINQPIGTKGAMAIANLLQSSKSLEKVNMSNCGLDCEKVCHLAQALCESTTLRGLNLSFNPIGTKGAMAIANLLQSSTSLEKVNISNCGLDCEKVCHLAEALCESTTLRGLNLSFNPIGTKGAMILAVLIHSNKSLEEVNVRNCNIGSDGACHLACSWELCVNTSLRKLDLSRNPIGTEGAMALAEVIRSNNSLEEVIINFDGEGAYHLAEALCENTALRKLDLSYSPSRHERATAEVKAKLLEAQRVNSTLQELALPGETFSF